MRIDYRGKGLTPMPRCQVTNLDTGERITPIAMADDQTGEFVRYVTRADGIFVIEPQTKRVLTESGRARLKIELLGMW